MKIKVQIKEACDLFSAISSAAPISASNVKRLIKGKEAKINGKRVGENIALSIGDEVECFIPQSFMGQPPKIIYEDENVLIADKPVHIEIPALKEMLKKQNSFLEPVHRIDRNTVGLVAFAKNETAYKALNQSHKRTRCHKKIQGARPRNTKNR